jgi:hypothetical protein
MLAGIAMMPPLKEGVVADCNIADAPAFTWHSPSLFSLAYPTIAQARVFFCELAGFRME